MIDWQRKLRKSTGNDTHVRSIETNAFSEKSTKAFEVLSGEILLTQPEPIFRQNAVTVQLSRGGKITGVAYPGAFIDPKTGNLHGSYEGPIPGQMVNVGFLNGNSSSPYVVNRYPYQGIGNTFVSVKYIQPLTKKLYDATDVLMGHFSGSIIRLNTGLISGKLPGSISIESVTDTEITALTSVKLTGLNIELNGSTSVKSSGITVELAGSTLVKLSGLTVELNGNTNWAVKYTELKAAFDQLKSDVNTFITTLYNIHIHPTPAGPSSVTVSLGTASLADMSAAKNAKVLM